MARIPQKVSDRFSQMIKKYQKILQSAKDKDINEADTVTIISNMLHEVFGYDQFQEITREFAIKNTYCDLAITIDNDIQFLIEVKSIGSKLNDNHINQATHYGADKGIEWVVLTNGVNWNIYRMSFGTKIKHSLICDFDFLEFKPKNQSDHEQLFILCKEGLKKDAIKEFHDYKKIVNKYYIGAIVLSDTVQEVIRRELKKSSSGIKLDDSEISNLLKNDVLKRDVVDSEFAADAIDKYKQLLKKAKKKSVQSAKTRTKEAVSKASEPGIESVDADIPDGKPAEEQPTF